MIRGLELIRVRLWLRRKERSGPQPSCTIHQTRHLTSQNRTGGGTCVHTCLHTQYRVTCVPTGDINIGLDKAREFGTGLGPLTPSVKWRTGEAENPECGNMSKCKTRTPISGQPLIVIHHDEKCLPSSVIISCLRMVNAAASIH